MESWSRGVCRRDGVWFDDSLFASKLNVISGQVLPVFHVRNLEGDIALRNYLLLYRLNRR
jgi:hypothetical protein